GAPDAATQTDRVAEETPVALEYNGISHATMLASPADLEDFALGFSLTEGIVDRPADVRGIEVAPQFNGIVVQMEISSACAARLKARRRAMAGRTGCGLCRPPPPGPWPRCWAPGGRCAAARRCTTSPAPLTPRPGPTPAARCAWCARTWAATMRWTS